MRYVLATYQHGDTAITYNPPATTGAVYTVIVDILSRDMLPEHKAASLAHWAAQWCDMSPAELLESHADALGSLVVDMVAMAGLDPEWKAELQALVDIGTGADDYDPKAEPKACECPRCAGTSDDAALCKYRSITERAFVLMDWTHLADNPQFWDKPLSLYQLARINNLSRIQGRSADRQKREKEEAERSRAKATREKYGHRW